MITAKVALLAFALDHLFGELPSRWHPLVAFGRLADAVEQKLYKPAREHGVIALAVLVVPLVWFAWLLTQHHFLGTAIAALLLYTTIGLRSLREHALPVANALDAGELDAARQAVGRIVSRDTAALDETQVAAAATESVLENGNDAVFGALFWFAVAGAPGAVLYRLVNTLDAMWGYRNERYEHFGWAAAKLDDVLNFIPARMTAFTYALFGHFDRAVACWRTQARAWDSPNAGPVMAAGAGALGVRLGGAAPYEGQWHERPVLGEGEPPRAADIRRALVLVRNGVLAWLVALVIIGLAHA